MGSSLESGPLSMQRLILAPLLHYGVCCNNPEGVSPGTVGGGREANDAGPRFLGGWRWPALLIALTAVALLLIYRRWQQTGFHWDVFAASFLHLRWEWVVASAVAALSTYYGRALRWAVMLRPLRNHPNVWNIFSATAIGFTALVLLGRPAEIVRPYLISIKERVPLSSQLATWLLERIYDLLAVLLVFGFALSQVQQSGAALGPGLQWAMRVGGYLVGSVSAVCLVVLFLLRQFSEPMRKRLLEALAFLKAHHFQKAERVVNAFVEGLGSTRKASFLGLIVLYTALEWVLITGCYLCLFRAYGVTAGFGLRDVLIFMGFVSLGSVVQIPGVGGGMQIVAILVLTELFGLSLELATSVAIMFWIVTFVVIVPFGLALAFHEGLNWKRIRQIEREAKL